MNIFFEFFSSVFAICIVFFVLYTWYCLLSVKRFINKRYEEETELLNTIFFKEHFIFLQYQPNIFSAASYSTHLIMCIWGWRLFGKKKIFRDIKDPEEVIKHFSDIEIYQVKRFNVVALIITLLMIAYLIFRIIWPEEFAR